jgi:DMSO/TMAO reductase YedYZ molybdopterin-dependent catalytic subunit
MELLQLSGEVDTPRNFTLAELAALPEQVPDVGALVPGRAGGGVRLSSVLAAVGARGAYLTLCSSDGFTISVPRAEVESGVVTYRLGDEGLPPKQGGPVRFYVARPVACDTGSVDACANVKALCEIRVTATKEPDNHRH